MTTERTCIRKPMGFFTKALLISAYGVVSAFFLHGPPSGGRSELSELYKIVERIADTDKNGELSSLERAAVYESLGIDYVPELKKTLTEDQVRKYIVNILAGDEGK